MSAPPTGSWTVGEDGRKIFSTHGIAERIVAAVPLDLGEGETERLERARLIAAAPDLLEALEAFLAEHESDGCEGEAHHCGRCVMGRAAIAKAGGQ